MKTIIFFFYIIKIFLFASCVPIDPPDPPEYYSKIVLMKNDLYDIIHSIDISKNTVSKIKQNLFFSLFYNTL